MEISSIRAQPWNSAYDSLRVEESCLTNAYETIVSLELTGSGADPQTNDIEQNDEEKRQLQFKEITELVLARIKAKEPVTTGVRVGDRVQRLMHEMNEKARLAAQEVAIPWVGFSLLLEVLSSSTSYEAVNRQGLASVTARMDGYWTLSMLLLDKNRAIPFTEGSRDTLMRYFQEFCRAVLTWQMKAVCLYCSQFACFQSQLPDICSWDAETTEIRHTKFKVMSLTSVCYPEHLLRDLTNLENTAACNAAQLRNMHSEDLPRLCSACGNLDPSVWEVKYYRTHVDDVRDASSDCESCRVIAAGLSRFVRPLDGNARLSLSVGRGSSLMVAYHWGVVNGDGCHGLEFFVEEGYPTPWPAVGHGRLLRSGAAASLKVLSTWFRECQDNHRTCKAPSRTLPTRVLHVGSDTCEPYLHLPVAGEEGQYTALSHCWGTNSEVHFTTTKKTLESRKTSVLMSDLPRTFRDAVLVTRSLGISYLWIDSLCIVQDDDDDDWARESARMADVYQNATLTISADGARDGSDGLFATISKSHPVESFQCQDGSQVYARETTLPSGGDFVHLVEEKDEEPLRRRGWTLQEWLLPNAIVHFTTGEMLWECNEIHLCECQLASQSPSVWDGQGQRYLSKFDYYHSGVGAEGQRGNLNWSLVMAEYSTRKLTKETDRLPALSGLAKIAKPNAEVDYVAGLWRSEFPDTLLWQVKGDESSRQSATYAPTWSWASICGEIDFNDPEENDDFQKGCRVLDCGGSLVKDNPFGHLKDGSLQVKGVVGILVNNMRQEADVLKIEGKSYRGELVLDLKGLPFEVMADDEIPFLIVRRGTLKGIIQGLALKTVEGKPDTFTRVGYISVTFTGNTSERGSWLQKMFSISRQTLTIL